MRTHYRLYFLLMAVSLFAGCSSPARLPETPTITSLMVVTTIPLVPTLTPSATMQATSTATPLPPENILKYQPFDIISDLPSDVNPGGALVICREPLQLLHFNPQVSLETIFGIGDSGDCPSPSLDGRWLAYGQYSKDHKHQWLIVKSADGQQQKKVPVDIYLAVVGGDYIWLDSQRLIFVLLNGQHEPANPMVAINPFTGQQVQLTSNYPDLQPSPLGPATSMTFNISDVVYDPSLNLVLYPSWGKHNYLILWDRQSKSVVAKIEDKGVFDHYPLWSPDAKQLAIAVTDQAYKVNDEWFHADEWFLISQDGQVEKFTHFGDYFTNATIGSFAKWSPDGTKLAFWLETTPSPCPGFNLAILEVATKQVTNTCLPGKADRLSPPIWSLNSRYVIAVNENTDPVQIFLVDVKAGWAFDMKKIIPDSGPIGWLVSP